MSVWLERPAIVILSALLAGAIVALVIQHQDDSGGLEITLPHGTPTAGGPIEVYVTGAVMRPGLYEMQGDARGADALEMAGGAAPDADLEAANLAVRLHDEDKVFIPRLGQTTTTTTASAVVSEVAGTAVININTATAEELDALPGIGEVYSQRIVDSRTNAGPFASPEELVTRDLIPRSTYTKIEASITVGP